MPAADNTVDRLKQALPALNGYDTWEAFVAGQSMGECQSIADDVKRLSGLEHVIGEFQLDEPVWSAEDEDEIDRVTHHWNVDADGNIYDFAKGTLADVFPDYAGDLDPDDILEPDRYIGISTDN